MNVNGEWTTMLLQGILSFFLNPVLYLFALLIYLHYRKQMMLERQLFSARLQSPLVQTIRSLGMGLVAGLIVSLISIGLGIVVQVQDMYIVFVLALLLAMIRIRYLCLAYASGVLAILHVVALLLPGPADLSGIGVVWIWLQEAKPLPLLALVALLHLAEALLVRWNAGRDASPLFIEGKRGRIVGAYELHSFWLTPLVMLVEFPGGGMSGSLFAGWPLFSADAPMWSLVLLPAVTGYSDLTQTMTAGQKAREIAGQLMLYSLCLLALAFAAIWLPALLVIVALYALFGHEGMVMFSRWRENKLSPYYVQSLKGIKVMGVLPQTPAAEMGVKPGEIIVKVNGVPVKDREQLYPALQLNPAYCKMEVLTHEGEIKFVQSAVYAGQHHQLGIIVVPDGSTRYFVDTKRASIVQLLKQRMSKLKIGA